MILILSNKWDMTVDFVISELRRREHDFLRINTEDLVSMRAAIQLPDLIMSLSKHGSTVNLTQRVNVV